MPADLLIPALQAAVPDVEIEAGPATDQPTLFVPAARLLDVCGALRDAPALHFRLLADLTAVDWWPRDPRFEVVYHLACLGDTDAPSGRVPATRVPPPARLRLKVRVAAADARLPTVSLLWPSANWLEREVWDLFGIVFDGHPDLRRLLMPDEWEGHPLRKDYPVQVRIAVKTYEPLQLTEEEFVRNVRGR